MRPDGAPVPTYIDTASELEALCGKLGSASWIAIDTEFMREKTYYAQLCLIQVGAQDLIACIDPLAIADLSPLYRLLANNSIVKVMHSCHQDMEILYQSWGQLPDPVFDTQIAAPLLGYPQQMGYARLVEELLGVQLEKGQTRSDWSRRPLSRAQLDYAADDVIYLERIYERMHDDLEKRHRLDWLQEDFARLSQPGRYEQPPENAWQRIRSAQRLRPRQLNVLKAFAGWRETVARTRDIPRNWILRDEVLVEMSTRAPQDMDALQDINGLSPKALDRYGDRFISLIRQALDMPVSAPVAPPRRVPKLDKRDEARLEALLKIVERSAEENDIHASALTSRKELSRLILGEKDIGLLSGWKKSIVGNELLDFLNQDS